MTRSLRVCAFALTLVTNIFAAADRIPALADTSRYAPLQGHRRPEAVPANDLGPVDPAMKISYASIFFHSAAGLESFLAEQQNPGSPDYHRWLTPEQFGDRFGLGGNDLALVRSWLQGHGLNVHDTARGRLWITFSGTAAQMNKAFKTELRRYSANGKVHFANAKEISVPAAFAPVVKAVSGLDDFVPEHHHVDVPLSSGSPLYNSGANHYLAPDDIATIYNIAPLYSAGIDGTGQKLAIIGRTDVDLNDIRIFRSRFNLPPNDPQVVLFGPAPGKTADLVEANLDLEWSGAVARNATIIYVNSTNVRTSAQYAVDQNLAPVMSYSYGGCENFNTDNLRGVAQQANAQGITWMASSGDSGATTCDSNSPTGLASKGTTASYPATIPEITAVGGTQFDDTTGQWWASSNNANLASALGYIPERVWNQATANNRIEGGGGAASVFYPKPAWQLGPGVPNDGFRDIPDISFSGATHDAYFIISNGVAQAVGGTSASSPVFAGIVALLNQSLAKASPDKPSGVGNINPALYRMAQNSPEVFHDTTVGDNAMPCLFNTPNCVNGFAGFPATPGYDLATGLGSLDVNAFLGKFNVGTASTTTITADPANYQASDKVTLTATVTGTSGVATGSIDFVAATTALGSATLVAGKDSSTAVLQVDGSLLAGGNGVVGALYSGDAIYTASSGNTSIVLKRPATGSFVTLAMSPFPVRQSGTSWPYTFTIAEKNGTPTRITAFTVNGVNNISGLSTLNLAANGSILFLASGSNLTVPLNRIFHVEGSDADGSTWTREITVPFVAGSNSSLAPKLSLTATNLVAQQDPSADPTCQWPVRLTIQESGGFTFNLSSITGLSGTISQTFGTTRLAPFGFLSADVCPAAVTPPASRTFTLSGTPPEYGGTFNASAAVTLAAAAIAPAAFKVGQSSIQITDTANLDLNFTTGKPAWTASLVPSTTKWLTLSKASGSGSDTLTLTAKQDGLSPGAYFAMVSIGAQGALPQAIQVPVSMVIGSSSSIHISGVGNAASGAQNFAPGQLIAIYGSGLALTTLSATRQPLPYSLAGVSATVNGISAPLWFLSPGQINLQIPYEVSAGPALLGINNNGAVASYPLTVTPTAPGIFAYNGGLIPPYSAAAAGGVVVAYITGDGDVTPTLSTGVTPAAGTGLASLPKSRQALSVTVGGKPANILFNGIVSGLIGVTQVNFTIPAGLTPGLQPVVVTVGGVSSSPVNVTVNP